MKKCLDNLFSELMNVPSTKINSVGEFVMKGSNDCIAIDQIPSKECNEYHKNSVIQIHLPNDLEGLQ